jgi:hypothetical protein
LLDVFLLLLMQLQLLNRLGLMKVDGLTDDEVKSHLHVVQSQLLLLQPKKIAICRWQQFDTPLLEKKTHESQSKS